MVVVVVVAMLGGWLVRVVWWRRARCRSWLVVLAWRGPRIWLRQKQRCWDVWIASLGMVMLFMWEPGVLSVVVHVVLAEG